MSWLLDTNVISELRKPESRVNPGVVRWVNDHDSLTLHISAITVLELELGVARKERKDQAQGRILRRWFEDDVLPTFAGRVLSIDQDIARRAAQLHLPDPRPERDTMIAATALAYGMTVVTRNVRDFVAMRAKVLNPWTDEQ